MSKQRRIFGLGLIAGAALGYWLNTEKGKAFRSDVAKKVGEYSDELSVLAKENALKLSGNLSAAMEDGQKWVAGARGKLKSTLHDLAETAEHAVDEAAGKLETGLEKANRKVKENTARLQDGKGEKA